MSIRSWWPQSSPRHREEISPWIGLSLGVLYLAAVAGVGAAALHFQQSSLRDQRVADAKQWAYWLGRGLSRVGSSDMETLRAEVRKAGREPGVVFCALVDDGGSFVAHSDPERIGLAAPVGRQSREALQPVETITAPGMEAHTVLVSQVPSWRMEEAPLELWLGLEDVRIALSQSQIAFWTGYVLLAVLGLYLLAYRLLRRSVHQLAVIRNRLVGCGESIGERVAALRLNDSYDQISASWNRLIDFISDQQEQLQRTRLTTDVTAAMDGYRSERLSTLLMQVPFGIFLVDSHGTVSFANRSANGLLGLPGTPVEGLPALDVLGEALLERLSDCVEHTGNGRKHSPRWVDHTFDRPDQSMTLRFWVSHTENNSGELIVFVQDVTQAKEVERARDNFLYHVTHEFRTPLTNIRAYAETLSQGVIDDEQTIRECYNVIMGETNRLGRLVEDLLNISQLEVGTAKLTATEVQLDEVMRKVVQDNQGGADAKNIDLALRLPAKMPRIMGDRDRLAVVFNNIIGNGIKYTPEGGRVEVHCVAEDRRVEISVSDTGIGIRPEDQERVFDKFYRVDDERVASIPGSGLGLAIARETVRAHQGRLTLESTEGKGTTFHIVLPALGIDESRQGPAVSNQPTAGGT